MRVAPSTRFAAATSPIRTAGLAAVARAAAVRPTRRSSVRLPRRLSTVLLTLAVGLSAASIARADVLYVNALDDLDDAGHCHQTAQSLPALGFMPDTHCTLREAIRNADEHSGADQIYFSVAGTIVLATPLYPLIDSGTTIDGFVGQSNPGSAGSNLKPGVLDSYNPCANLRFRKPRIAIDGPNTASTPNSALLTLGFPTDVVPANAFTIAGTASNIVIRGLAVYGTGQAGLDNAAVEAWGGPGTNRLVDAMFIGLLATGTDPGLANRNQGFGARQLNGGQLTVNGSFIGFNGLNGVDGEADASVVTITGNEVFRNGWNSDSHDGLDINGVDSIGRCNYSHHNTNVSNTPKGDAGAGFEIGSQRRTRDRDNNLVEYNTLYSNVSAGMNIRKGPRGNTIRKNVIWNNPVGISINTEDRAPTNRNMLTQNSTFRNTRLGIDLQAVVLPDQPWTGKPDGVTPNDHCDIDGVTGDGDIANTASNDLQNFPILTNAKRIKKKTYISGTFDSTPGKYFDIEFFATPAADLSNFVETDGTDFVDREGKLFLGHVVVQTSLATCSTSFTATALIGVPDNYRVSATARLYQDDPGGGVTLASTADVPWSTSEYSNMVKAKSQDVDNDDISDCPHVHHEVDSDGEHDCDCDGIKNKHDDKRRYESQESDSGKMQRGQSRSYQMSASPTSLLLTAFVQEASQDPEIPDDPDAPLPPLPPLDQPFLVDIYDPLGNLVASSLPAPGIALAATVPVSPGIYTIKVRNVSTRDVTFDSYLITRDAGLAPPPLP